MRPILKRLFFLLLGFSSAQAALNVTQIKLGVLRNDVRGLDLHHHYEKGKNINIEALFPELTGGVWDWIFNPEPAVGTHINTNGATSHIYGGINWTIHMGQFLLEPQFGGDIHNGETRRSTLKKHALGSRILFHQSLSFGYKITDKFTGYLTVDHVSNARLSKPNPGITSVGLRAGYRF